MRKNGEEGTQSKMAVMDWPTAGECWIDQATTALQADGSLVSGISYNRWFTDQDYREELAAVYGVPNVETALDGVPNFSNGSSFDGLSKQGNARRMNVLRR